MIAVNYLAHARDLLESPWAVAGAGLPDWLRRADPAARLREPPPDFRPSDRDSAELLRGLAVRHAENRWFHAAPAFREECAVLARAIRAEHPDRPDRRRRASFLAHVLVEILLDGALLARRPRLADDYYRALAQVDPERLAAHVRGLVPTAPSRLAEVFDRFRRARFLGSATDDRETAARLSAVAERFGEPPLPPAFAAIVARFRPRIGDRADLLIPPAGLSTPGAAPAPPPPPADRADSGRR